MVKRYVPTYEDYAALRAEVAKLEEKTRWIPVEERLPSVFDVVLVKCGFPFAIPAQLELGMTWLGQWPNNEKCGGAQNLKYVTHWMPLPEIENHD